MQRLGLLAAKQEATGGVQKWLRRSPHSRFGRPAPPGVFYPLKGLIMALIRSLDPSGHGAGVGHGFKLWCENRNGMRRSMA